jgi:hypothetical protein
VSWASQDQGYDAHPLKTQLSVGEAFDFCKTRKSPIKFVLTES